MASVVIDGGHKEKKCMWWGSWYHETWSRLREMESARGREQMAAQVGNIV